MKRCGRARARSASASYWPGATRASLAAAWRARGPVIATCNRDDGTWRIRGPAVPRYARCLPSVNARTTSEAGRDAPYVAARRDFSQFQLQLSLDCFFVGQRRHCAKGRRACRADGRRSARVPHAHGAPEPGKGFETISIVEPTASVAAG